MRLFSQITSKHYSCGFPQVSVCNSLSLKKLKKLVQGIFVLLEQVHFKVFILIIIGLLLEEIFDCLAGRQEVYRSITSNCLSEINEKRIAAKDL